MPARNNSAISYYVHLERSTVIVIPPYTSVAHNVTNSTQGIGRPRQQGLLLQTGTTAHNNPLAIKSTLSADVAFSCGNAKDDLEESAADDRDGGDPEHQAKGKESQGASQVVDAVGLPREGLMPKSAHQKFGANHWNYQGNVR